MRYLKFTFAFFALLLAGLTFAGATELYDRLIALKGVVSVEELEKGLKELKGFATPQKEQQYEPSSTPRLPGTKLPTKSTLGGTQGSSHICN